MGNVRTAAEIYEVALAVGRKDLSLKAVDHLHLQIFTKLREELSGLLFCMFLPHKGDLFLRYFPHF